MPDIKARQYDEIYILDDFYDISRRVIRCGEETSITLTPRHPHRAWEFLLRQGGISIQASHMDCVSMLDGHPYCGKDDFDALPFTIDGNTLAVTIPAVADEGMISLVFVHDEAGKPRELFTLELFALRDDLYGLRPFRGDFHLHSSYSACGKRYEDPRYVVSVGRAAGLDFIAVTDHSQIHGSEAALEYAALLETSYRIFPGEECHMPKKHLEELFRVTGNYPWMHIVNFGGREGVCRWISQHWEEYLAEVEKRMVQYPAEWHEDLRRLAAATGFTFDKIHEFGGIAVFSHPFWISSHRFNLPRPVREKMLEECKFDVIEVPGLWKPFKPDLVDGNCLADAMWHEASIKAGKLLPIAGITDSHEAKMALGSNTTVVFSADGSFDSIASALRSGNSATVTAIPGRVPSFTCRGPERLVAYTQFLLHDFYPIHDEYCRTEGNLMLAQLRGEVTMDEVNAFGRGRLEKLFKKFFG
jgi:hypothetical protein